MLHSIRLDDDEFEQNFRRIAKLFFFSSRSDVICVKLFLVCGFHKSTIAFFSEDNGFKADLVEFFSGIDFLLAFATLSFYR